MEINGNPPELNNIAKNCEKSPNEVLKPLPEHWVAALFARFQARYGHKWTSAMQGIEEIAVKEWAQGLANITGEQMRQGLADWNEPWPPSLPEFRNACLQIKKGENEYGLNFKPPYLNTYRVLDRSRLLSSTERDAERAAVKPKIEAILAAIKNPAEAG